MSHKNLQMGRSCKLEERKAKLSSDFGLNLLKKKVTKERFEEIMEEVGILKSGPNKGKSRGHIVWTKILEGGFDYEKGRVLRGGCVDFYVEYTTTEGEKYKVDVDLEPKSKRESFVDRKPEFEARLSDLEKLIVQCDRGIREDKELGDHEMVDFYEKSRVEYMKEIQEIKEKLSKMV